MTIVEFIEARVAEIEHNVSKHHYFIEVSGQFHTIAREMLAVCQGYRDILELHNNWVVALETPITYETDLTPNPLSIDSYLMKASREVMFLTEQQYRLRFNKVPPTAPMIRAVARIWKDHADYQEEWV